VSGYVERGVHESLLPDHVYQLRVLLPNRHHAAISCQTGSNGKFIAAGTLSDYAHETFVLFKALQTGSLVKGMFLK
jgi:hypothetical protein